MFDSIDDATKKLNRYQAILSCFHDSPDSRLNIVLVFTDYDIPYLHVLPFLIVRDKVPCSIPCEIKKIVDGSIERLSG